jgi:hypothetical protein
MTFSNPPTECLRRFPPWYHSRKYLPSGWCSLRRAIQTWSRMTLPYFSTTTANRHFFSTRTYLTILIRSPYCFGSTISFSWNDDGFLLGDIAESVLFKETPAHSSLDWHNAPTTQYVITLAGVLEFTTVGGETFTIHPRQILVAEDNSGSGHKWRLVNDEPWKRAYVVFKEGADTHFLPDPA